MKNPQVIILLKMFSHRELKRLEQLLQSPFFNTSARCWPLYQWIKTEVLETGNEFDKNLAFKALFPEEKHSMNSLNVIMSKLQALAEEVLIQEQLRLRQYTRNYLLMKAIGEKGDGKSLRKLGQQSLKKLQTTQRPTREDYSNKYLITNLLYEWEVTTEQSKKQKPEEVVTALDAFYLSHRLPITYEMIGLQQLMSVEYQNVMTDRVLALSETIPLADFPLVELYRQAILLAKEKEGATHFAQYQSTLEKHATAIPPDELHSFYAIAQNFCIQQIITGKQAFLQHLFEIYKQMIARKVLFISKYIPARMIKNVVALSCQLGEYAWAHWFLKTYSSELAPANRQQTVNFYQATIFFYEQNYEKARELLVQKESMEVFFEISRKFLLLKIYYELKEDVALVQLIVSFKAFIRSNKSLSKEMKDSYVNFAKSLKALANLRVNITSQKRQAFRRKLEDFQMISDKRWLIEKLTSL